jgi:EAL domain-containing protein (putative c-di-GMP-specific phosphodiesterase class I)
MYGAKAAGTGHGFFRPEYLGSSRERAEAVQRLRHAIDVGEMTLYYQPQVSLATGEVVSVEALVRWQHPDAGLLPPASFLSQAENGGLMAALTASVLEQAISQCAAWREDAIDMRVGVNLSVTNLLDPEFPAQVVALLDASGVPGRSLVLELTEDLFMADPAKGARVIGALRDAGITIVVDDYGTGYSSLAYLRDLRTIGGLKLDRSFVTHLDTDPRARAIVESTVALARSLDLALVAEGVETEVVRDHLASLGCEFGQGFLFSRPCPPDALSFGVIESALAVPGR